MNLISIINTLLIISIASAAETTRINLFIKSIDDASSSDSIGFIDNDSVYLMEETPLNPDKFYCIGTKDLENHECFTFLNGVDSLNHTVIDAFMDKDNAEIVRLSLTFAEESTNKLRKHRFAKSPVPNLNPDSLKKLKQQQQQSQEKGKVEIVKQKRIIKVTDDEGNEVEKEIEEEIEVDNRSWIQKNWMYIVPPLILFLIMGGDNKQ
ncbi:hypothetical protein SBY92_000582 [Candida maltosa Xu316]|uniref:Putative transmembrane protein n=1 Tax=Candida maltosa (strain Xu316) TaxID=1245528 RepID=M3K3A2_CANMX|nr:putative transmembrane protein [Candida maltosa Xu316]